MTTLRDFQLALQEKIEELQDRDDIIDDMEEELLEKTKIIHHLKTENAKYRALLSNTPQLSSTSSPNRSASPRMGGSMRSPVGRGLTRHNGIRYGHGNGENGSGDNHVEGGEPAMIMATAHTVKVVEPAVMGVQRAATVGTGFGSDGNLKFHQAIVSQNGGAVVIHPNAPIHQLSFQDDSTSNSSRSGIHESASVHVHRAYR